MIFISHAATDSEIASALKEAILASFSEAEVFVSSDPEDLSPGDPWIEKILDALRKSSIVLALTTERGLSRRWVWFESGRTWFSGVKIIPCCVGTVRKSSLPAPFSSIQGLNIDIPADLVNLFGSLSNLLGNPGPGADFKALSEELTRLDIRAEQRQLINDDPDASELRNEIKKKMVRLPRVQQETIRQVLLRGELNSLAAQTLVRESGQDMSKFYILDALARETGVLTSTYRAPSINEQWENAYKINEKVAPYLREYFRENSGEKP
jgi:hypothetical protein